MSFKLRNIDLRILPRVSNELKVLHFSDLHLTPRSKREMADIRSWAELDPDLVIGTGDFLGHKDSIEAVQYALDPLLSKPGLFVFGSNDYYSPKLKNPFGYLRKDRGVRVIGERLRTEDLSIALKSRGWEDLNNKKVEFEIEGISIEARGTNDAHLLFDDYSIVAGTRDKKVDLSIGITHAPYGRIIDSMSRDNIDIVFAGHTHGGQVRIPWFGGTRSLTTNCDLPNWRSRGLTKIDGESYLHVSAGMGYNPYTPIRFLCPREVSIIKFLPII